VNGFSPLRRSSFLNVELPQAYVSRPIVKEGYRPKIAKGFTPGLSESLTKHKRTRMQSLDHHETKRKQKRLIRILVGIAALVFIIIPALALTGLWISVRHEKTARPSMAVVPHVVGQEYRKGESLLNEKGLKMQVNAVRWDQNQPVGIILDQNPLHGVSIDAKRAVSVIIERGG
jgi:hypothetical protein